MSTLTWRRSISKPAIEFPLTKLQILEGKISPSIHGSFYHNGPARLERGGHPITHWFDGDGAVLGIHFDNGEARAVYKYVQSKWVTEEEKADKFLYRGFGQTVSGGLFQKLFSREFKNAGNTSVLPLPDKVLALWEGGWPFAMDCKNLDTIKLDDLGFLKQGQTFSAHPKVDYETGEIYSIGNRFERGNCYLCLYRCDKNGKLIKQNEILYRVTMIHDFIIAGKYIVIMGFPLKMTQTGGLSYVLGLKSFNDILEWTPEIGTEVFVFDRNNLSLVKRFTTDPFFVFHYTNGYVEKDGTIYVEFVKYNTYETVGKYLNAVSHLDQPLPPEYGGSLSYMKIDPEKGRAIELKDISDDCFEFPTVADEQVGKKWRYSMFNYNPKSLKFEDMTSTGIGRYDHKTQSMQTFCYGTDRYAAEPILINSRNNSDPEEGHILTMVYDAKDHKSEMCIHESGALEKGPICRLLLPEVVPRGFHGRFQHSS